MKTLSNLTRPVDEDTIYVDDRLNIDMAPANVTIDGVARQMYCSNSYDRAIQLPTIKGYVWKVIDTGPGKAGPQLVCVREVQP
jgi:hypothetical protein